MGLRETIQKNAGLWLGVIAVLVVGVFAFRFAQGGQPEAGDAVPAFYTVDDGATYFAAPGQVSPFDHEGREAVAAAVFRDRETGNEFVGYLTKLATEEDRQKVLQLMADPSPNPTARPNIKVLVKRPGEGEWVGANTEEGSKIQNITTSPEGNAAVSIAP